MATFTENIKALTEELAGSAQTRGETLDSLRTETERLLSSAEELLQRLGREHDAMATQVRSTLSKERQEQVQQVAAAREQINQHFHELQERLRQTLRTCRQTRHDHLDHMLQGFEEARQALANDLQEAGRI